MLRSRATDSGARSGADYLTWEYMRNRSHAKHDLSATVAATQEDKMWVQGSDSKWRKSMATKSQPRAMGCNKLAHRLVWADGELEEPLLLTVD